MDFSILQAVFDQSPTGIAVFSPDAILLKANAAYGNLTGYSPAELEGTPAWRVVHPDDGQHQQDRFQQLWADTTACPSWETRIIRKDGSVIWVVLHAHLEPATGSRAAHAICFFT